MAVNFGNTIRYIRDKNGWSLEEMAQKLDTTKQALSYYERGERTPKITVAAKFADILGIPLEQLIGLEETEPVKDETPKSREAQIIAKLIDRLTPSQRKQALNVIKAMFPQHQELFEEEK